MIPKGFVSLTPSFWSWPMWKSAVYMHHDVQLLEQVFYQTCFSNMHNFCSFVSCSHVLSSKTLEKDPLHLDQDKEMHSASETESEGNSDSEAVTQDAPTTNKGTLLQKLKIFKRTWT